MTRTVLSGVAALAMLAVLADTPVEAQQFRQQSGASTSNSGGGNATMRRGRTRSRPQGSQQLSSGQPQPSANTGAAIHAINTYLLWKKRCLNNLLPRCE